MSDYENSIFNNLPRRKRRLDDDDNTRSRFREALGMYEPEGPLPPRPRPSGVGGPSINQGTGTPSVTSVWSAADAAANGMTLSNGGLTATEHGAGWHTIRGSIGLAAGKVYVEFLCNVTGSNAAMFGATSSFQNGTLGTSNYSGGISYTANYVTAGFTSNYTRSNFPSANEVWALAVDFAAGGIWLARNNVWINGSNPATGSLPILSFAPATVGVLFPGLTLGTDGDIWTLQPTPASQKYAPPSGFSPWG